MPRTRRVITPGAEGRWREALREAERQLRSQTNQAGFGTFPVVTQEAIRNRAIQIGGRPPRTATGGADRNRQTVVRGRNTAAGRQANAPSDPLQDLIESFQASSDEANEANKARRDAIMRQYGDLISNVVGRFENREQQFEQDIAGFGEGERARINRAFDQAGARAQADLVGRGLTASTVLPSVRRGVEEDRERALLGLADRVAGQRISGRSQLSGDTAQAVANLTGQQIGFQERINETGPDFSQLAQLAQLYGAGNAGQGFGVSIPQSSSRQSGGTRIGIPAFGASPTGIIGNVGGFIPGITGQLPTPNVASPAQQMLLYQQLVAQQQDNQFRQPPLQVVRDNFGNVVSRSRGRGSQGGVLGHNIDPGFGGQVPSQVTFGRNRDVMRRFNNAYFREHGRRRPGYGEGLG